MSAVVSGAVDATGTLLTLTGYTTLVNGTGDHPDFDALAGVFTVPRRGVYLVGYGATIRAPDAGVGTGALQLRDGAGAVLAEQTVAPELTTETVSCSGTHLNILDAGTTLRLAASNAVVMPTPPVYLHVHMVSAA